jgi:hypothetical protein
MSGTTLAAFRALRDALAARGVSRATRVDS